VSNGIFIRTYPRRGVQAIPASYPAGANGYFIICLLPVSATVWFGVAIYNSNPRPSWLFGGLFISVVALLFSLACLRELRLDIRADGISYASLFRGTRFIAFADISTVVFIDYKHIRSEAQPRRSLRTWTAIITPNPETSKSAMRIPLTLFPTAAYTELTRLLQPEVWESAT
jgi:hypothetical protein